MSKRKATHQRGRARREGPAVRPPSGRGRRGRTPGARWRSGPSAARGHRTRAPLGSASPFAARGVLYAGARARLRGLAWARDRAGSGARLAEATSTPRRRGRPARRRRARRQPALVRALPARHGGRAALRPGRTSRPTTSRRAPSWAACSARSRASTQRVTIPEGFNRFDIAQAPAAAPRICGARAFLDQTVDKALLAELSLSRAVGRGLSLPRHVRSAARQRTARGRRALQDGVR